jgi:hypothetical protein
MHCWLLAQQTPLQAGRPPSLHVQVLSGPHVCVPLSQQTGAVSVPHCVVPSGQGMERQMSPTHGWPNAQQAAGPPSGFVPHGVHWAQPRAAWLLKGAPYHGPAAEAAARTLPYLTANVPAALEGVFRTARVAAAFEPRGIAADSAAAPEQP